MKDSITILLASDNHCAMGPMEYVRSCYSSADYFFHCGDSEFSTKMMEGWAAVEGNNDYYHAFPDHLIVEVGGHRILLTHSHRDMLWNHWEQLVHLAKQNDCDVVCFGHTHVWFDQTIDGVRLLNPGSMRYNRDGTPPCCMLITIDHGTITTEQISIPESARF